MRYPALKLITAPAADAFDLTAAKIAMKVDHDADDDMVELALRSAVEMIEAETGRALITQTWDAFYQYWPARFLVPKPKLQSVGSIKYKIADGTEDTLDSSTYIVDVEQEPGRIVLADGAVWPSGTLYPVNPITIRFTCGYGAAASDIPDLLTRAIYWQAQHNYDFRNPVMFGSGIGTKVLERGVVAALSQYVVRFADGLSD